jgi:hypothetical protein
LAFAAFLVSQDRTNGVFLICKKSYVRKLTPLLRPAHTIERKVLREKPVRLSFCLTAIKPQKRLKTFWKSYVRKTLICSTDWTSLTSHFPAMLRKVLREKITIYSEKHHLS